MAKSVNKWNFIAWSIYQWARVNRPDLIEASKDEWYRLHPEAKKCNKNLAVPEFLKNLK